MTLDFWLVARLAKDLDSYVSGARIQSLSAAGSELVFYCYRRGTHVALHVSVDSSEPLVAADECAEPQKESGTAGWLTSVSALLRGATIDAIHAVPNDRVLFVDVSSRSAFGVPSRSRIVIELQPRKANALVLREGDDGRWIIVAAAKQFEGTEEARRVTTGVAYELPPERRPLLDRAQFVLAARETEKDDVNRLARLLGDVDPECTPPLAREVVYRAMVDPKSTSTRPSAPAATGRALLETWRAVHDEVENALETSGEVFVVHKGGKPTLCHLIPLSWVLAGVSESSGTSATTARSVNEVCIEMLRSRSQLTRGAHGPDKLRKKLTTLIARGHEESARLEKARSRAADASHLRDAGDTIYAHLTEIATGADRFETEGRSVVLDPLLTAKENAAEYFRQYKKARTGLPRIEARLRTLRFNREYWEQLLWELDQAERRPASERQAVLAEIADALGFKGQPTRARRQRSQERRVTLSGDAVALVGRSPKENERLTFTVAGPNDYWFHARSIPGAHVIVKTNGVEISARQIEEAASLAAGHSRAADSAQVEVDYTQRKHVRRHSSRRAGLVWYTDFQTVRVRPRQG